ncbi:MAG: hypothetical protein LBH57_09140 [Treponema sp.]|jgi:hypothetical protein|nr:hypothetical protein [Treponema sp.]
MKRADVLLYLLVFALSGCAVLGPAGREEAVPETATVPSEAPSVSGRERWTVRDVTHLTAVVGFSDGDTEGYTECAVSFFNTLKDPKTVTAALLVAGGALHPLEGLRVAFVKSETHELGIRALLPRQALLDALKAETVYLIAVIDKIEYQFEPGRGFAAYKNTLLKQMER